MNELLSSKQVAGILGYQHAYIRQIILAGRLPAFKVGHTWLIKRVDVDTFQQQYPRGKRAYPRFPQVQSPS